MKAFFTKISVTYCQLILLLFLFFLNVSQNKIFSQQATEISEDFESSVSNDSARPTILKLSAEEMLLEAEAEAAAILEDQESENWLNDGEILSVEENEIDQTNFLGTINNSRPISLNAALTNHLRPQARILGAPSFDEELAPFYHGVASGDPLEDAVIIWTRITPGEQDTVAIENLKIEGKWFIAKDLDFKEIVQEGDFSTDKKKDFTVKIDVQNLASNQTYYYIFHALGRNSLTGRTRTAPKSAADIEHLRFAVVSCSNYESGYFNTYGRIADRGDLAAVLHLGDYIYEYATNDTEADRAHQPNHEALSLADYRMRHSLYKLDKDLQNAHQQHPFITIWDDHEVANNSWSGGADNHNENEGEWATRKALAKQAYFEWLPIREQQVAENQGRIYRQFKYGNLADLIMLDTRLEGRDKNVQDENDPTLQDTTRTMLGKEQFDWLLEKLTNSTAHWKVIGNQVAFSPIQTAGTLDNLDSWDGYPMERKKIVRYIDNNEIENVVFVTGDVHIGIAADVTLDPGGAYDPETGEGAWAVELVTPSISSNNLDEADADDLPFPIELIPDLALAINRHGKFVDLVNHGYFVLDLTPEKAQADWFWVATKTEPNETEFQEQSWFTRSGKHFLEAADTAIATQQNFPQLAPNQALSEVVGIENDIFTSVDYNCDKVIVLDNYPNPTRQIHQLNYALSVPQKRLTIALYDMTGKLVNYLLDAPQNTGIYTLYINVNNLANGIYLCHIDSADGTKIVKRIIVSN